MDDVEVMEDCGEVASLEWMCSHTMPCTGSSSSSTTYCEGGSGIVEVERDISEEEEEEEEEEIGEEFRSHTDERLFLLCTTALSTPTSIQLLRLTLLPCCPGILKVLNLCERSMKLYLRKW